MAPNYYGYELTDGKFQKSSGGGTPTIVEVDLLYANKVELDAPQNTITFEGDAQSRSVFVTTGLNATISPDCLTVAAAEALFVKTPVTTGLPTGLARLSWYGDEAESKGATVGFYARAIAIKNDAGVESVVTIRLWIPLGTLTLGGPPGFQTKEKLGQQAYRLSAVRATKDVIGVALAGVPANGAYYAIAEES